MKPAILVFSFLFACAAHSQEAAKTGMMGPEFTDPRRPVYLRLWLDEGEEPARLKNISNSLLIIHWMPAFDGSGVGYQISGLEGYHTQEQVERFLTAFYQMDVFKTKGVDIPNVIVAGNNWAAGTELEPRLKELSKAHSFSVFLTGGWAFRKASLVAESESRRELIQQAYQAANPR